jgi:hypothetical protein
MTGRGLWPFVLARAGCSNSQLNPDDWYPVSVRLIGPRSTFSYAVFALPRYRKEGSA